MNMSMRLASGAVALAAAAAIGVPAASAAQAAPLGTAAAGGSTAVATATVTTAFPWPVLREGRNAQHPPVTVRSLQYLLDAHGARLHVDGIFGPKTKAAVIRFQRAHHLPVTGVVRAGTWRALIITVKLGSRGNAVRAVQDQANFRNLKNGHSLDVDGIFGHKTEAWVRGFQRAVATMVHGFPVDGIVGPKTWNALIAEVLSL